MLHSEDYPASGGDGYFNRLQRSGVVLRFNQFCRSPWYVVLLAALTVLSNYFSLELPVYTVFIAFGIAVSIIGDDFLPLAPLVVFCYIAPSYENNPGRNGDSVFYPANGGIYLICLAMAFVVTLLSRLVMDKSLGRGKFLHTPRKLVPGMLILGTAYLLSGLGAEEYTDFFSSNFVFSLLQFAAVFVMYFFFSGAVRWERAPKGYLAWTGASVACVVVLELIHVYFDDRIFVNGTIDRELISTGWGIHNNMGCMIAMMIPYVFYLACTERRSWIYNALATLLLVGLGMTCSRGSIIFGFCAYMICQLLVLRNSSNRKGNLIGFLVALAGVIVICLSFVDELWMIFRDFISVGLDPSSRDKIYMYGFRQFLDYPVFGGSFFPRDYIPWDWSNQDAFTSFFPPRWHNTIVQIAASCGIVGLSAYLYHRVQTVKLFLEKITLEKVFIGLSLLVLLGTSLLDCHFFNVGPTLYYSMALAFAENYHRSEVSIKPAPK